MKRLMSLAISVALGASTPSKSFANAVAEDVVVPNQRLEHTSPWQPEPVALPSAEFNSISPCEAKLVPPTIADLTDSLIYSQALEGHHNGNIFNASLMYTILNALLFFTAGATVQEIAKPEFAGFFQDVIANEKYWKTFLIDMGLTYTSHQISLGNVPHFYQAVDFLKRKGMSDDNARLHVLAVIAGVMIHSGWIATGIELSAQDIAVGTVFTYASYHFLFRMKKFLFNYLPAKRNNAKYERLAQEVPMTKQVMTTVVDRLRGLNERGAYSPYSQDEVERLVTGTLSEQGRLDVVSNLLAQSPIEQGLGIDGIDLGRKANLLIDQLTRRSSAIDELHKDYVAESLKIDPKSTNPEAQELKTNVDELAAKLHLHNSLQTKDRFALADIALARLEKLPAESPERKSIERAFAIEGQDTQELIKLQFKLKQLRKSGVWDLYFISLADQTTSVLIFGSIFFAAVTLYVSTGQVEPWLQSLAAGASSVAWAGWEGLSKAMGFY